MRPLLGLIPLATLFTSLPLQASDRPPFREEREIAGWIVAVDGRLLAGPSSGEGAAALALLQRRLADIATILPADKLSILRGVRIVLDHDHGELRSMQYHPSAAWLQEKGYSSDLAKVVHIPVAARFLDPRHQQTQPCCVLHELAHAYHDQVLGFDNPRIHQAWEAYVKAGRGRRSLHVSGQIRPHYARTNAQEFFAEMTEAYFGTKDFAPFVHGQLEREEPELFALLREIWGPSPLE